MRKILVLVLAVMMVLAMVPTVALAEEPESEVKATVSSSYTIIIPPKVDFGSLAKGQEKAEPFPIEASDVVLEPGERIEIKVESDFLLTAGVAKLPYQLLKADESAAVSGKVYCSFSKSGDYKGKAKVNGKDITTAGVYSDVMVFKIGLNREIQVVTKGLRIETAEQAGDNGYFFELYFDEKPVGEYESVKVMAYYGKDISGEKKDPVPVAIAILRDIKRYAGSKVLTCSFYTDDHISSSWVLTKLPNRNCDKVVLEVVGKDGITYRCINDKVPYREPIQQG